MTFSKRKNPFSSGFFLSKNEKNCDRYRFWKNKPRLAKI